ncbi:MAG: SurA N-terminal domain-containing protein [Endomicrobium sp.]|jgi:parvulin-like peptidyl-prolyl isomerase|nr:SurA N-terminal domain-containing protein [Endomicrobium sp.]
MKKFAAYIMAALFLTAGSLYGASKDADKTLAVINGEPVFESEFNTILIPLLEEYKQNVPASEQTKQKENELMEMVLNQKIDEIVLKQEVKKQKIKASKKEVQQGIDEIRKKFANDSEFTAELKKENMSMSDFEKKIAEQVAIRKLLKQNLESKIQMPTEIEARELYDKAIAKIKGAKTKSAPEENALVSNLATALKRMSSEQIRVRQIFVSLPKGANEDAVRAAQSKVATIKKELQRQTFADVAGQYSEDPVSRPRNGDLGIIAKGDLLPVLDRTAFSMKVGDYTREPIKTDIGIFFLKIEERRAKKDITFDDVKNDMAEVLARINANNAQKKYIDELKAKANIKINKTW